MSGPARDASSTAPRAAILLPVAYLLHFAEEWLGEILLWARTTLGYEVDLERFLVINAAAFALFVLGTSAALRVPRMAWFAASLAALLGLNGVLHTLATLGWGRYAPGTVTGLLLYIPLSIVVLRSSASRLSRPVFTSAVVAGVAFHGLVTFVALL